MILIVIASIFVVQTFGDPIVDEGSLVVDQNNTVKQETGVNSSVINPYPWIVSILYNDVYIGTGSIINERVVLTLATICLATPNSMMNDFVVQVGSASDRYGSGTHAIVYSVIHPDFRVEFRNRINHVHNSVGLLKVWPKFTFGEKVRPVQLAGRERVEAPGAPARITAVGWHLEDHPGGARRSTLEVAATEVYITDNHNCPRINSSEPKIGGVGRICQTDLDSQPWKIDDGGSLMINGVQVGIIGWDPYSDEFNSSEGYINVSVYRDWIDANSNYSRPA